MKGKRVRCTRDVAFHPLWVYDVVIRVGETEGVVGGGGSGGKGGEGTNIAASRWISS